MEVGGNYRSYRRLLKAISETHHPMTRLIMMLARNDVLPVEKTSQVSIVNYKQWL